MKFQLFCVLAFPIANGCVERDEEVAVERGRTAVLTADRGDEVGKVAERGTIEKKYLWATESIFPNVEEWEKEYAAVEKAVIKLAEYKGTLNQGADHLYKIA